MVLFILTVKKSAPNRAKIQFNYTAFNAKGISSRKLSQLGISDFYRRYRIDNITQKSYAKIAPYLVGTSGRNKDNFVVITGDKRTSN